eukprot:6209074-Pleurochrysis_carterae.AAC.4
MHNRRITDELIEILSLCAREDLFRSLYVTPPLCQFYMSRPFQIRRAQMMRVTGAAPQCSRRKRGPVQRSCGARGAACTRACCGTKRGTRRPRCGAYTALIRTRSLRVGSR